MSGETGIDQGGNVRRAGADNGVGPAPVQAQRVRVRSRNRGAEKYHVWNAPLPTGRSMSTSWAGVANFTSYHLVTGFATWILDDPSHLFNLATEGDMIEYDQGLNHGWDHLAMSVGWTPGVGDWVAAHTTDYSISDHHAWNSVYLNAPPAQRANIKIAVIHANT